MNFNAIDGNRQLYGALDLDYMHRKDTPLSLEDRMRILRYCSQIYQRAQNNMEVEPLLQPILSDPALTEKLKPSKATWDEFYAAYDKTDELPIIGYGSLINAEDARRTMPTIGEVKKCLIFDFHRIFNLDDAEGSTRGKPTPGYETERGVLNVKPSGAFNPMNAVLFHLKKDESQAFERREKGMDLLRVPFIDWAALERGELTLGTGYMLIIEQEKLWDPHYALSTKPLLVYLYLIMEAGERNYGPTFTKMFCETTFLGDGKTSIAEYLNQQ